MHYYIFEKFIAFSSVPTAKRTSKVFLSIKVLKRAYTSVDRERRMVEVLIECKISDSTSG